MSITQDNSFSNYIHIINEKKILSVYQIFFIFFVDKFEIITIFARCNERNGSDPTAIYWL